MSETGGDKNLLENKKITRALASCDTNLVENNNFATQNILGKKNQFAVAAEDMKIIKPPPAAIIKITKPQLCAGFN